MYEYLTCVEVSSRSRKVKRGKKFFIYTWRWMPGLPIRDGKDLLEVNWLEITICDSNGKITYRNSFTPICRSTPTTSSTSPPPEGRGGKSKTKLSTHLKPILICEIYPRARHVQQFALPAHRQIRGRPLDIRPSVRRPHRPGLLAKKSRSTVNWPILLYVSGRA